MNVSKISNKLIDDFEKHYNENVIQPTSSFNDAGHRVTYVYSNQGNTPGKFANRCYTGRCESGYVYVCARYGMVYMETPNNKCIRHDYVFFDQSGARQIQTFYRV